MKHINALLLFFLASSTSMLFGQTGTLDNTFSTDGLVSTNLGASTFDRGKAIAIRDGKIIVVGTSGYDKAYDFGITRYLPDGTLDPSFSLNG
ncbi:MAG TPA: delta-60 repeat domain-containing protein, partial [Flavobacteriales bacterium]|nr:delta-60 repeat domain-containing protein [Flavobacteriales bacterium]